MQTELVKQRTHMVALACAMTLGACADEAASRQLADIEIDAGSDTLTWHDAGMHPGDADVPRDGASTQLTCALRAASTSGVGTEFGDPKAALSLAVLNDGASMSWSSLEGGKARLASRWEGLTGDGVDAPGVDTDSSQHQPTTAGSDSGLVTVWSDDASGTFELRARRVDAHGQQVDRTTTELTNDGMDNTLPVVATGANGNLLVIWFSLGTQRGHSLLLDAEGRVLGAARDLVGMVSLLARPALARLGEGFVVAWVDASRHVQLLRLDASGAASGDREQVDADGDAQGDLDLACGGSGGAVAFDILLGGVRPEVHVRSFDAAARLIGVEHNVTPYPDTGLRTALVATRGGFLLALRSVHAAQRVLRLALLDGHGALLAGSLEVGPLTELDLPIALRASPDATHAFLAWVDRTAGSPDYHLQHAWIECD